MTINEFLEKCKEEGREWKLYHDSTILPGKIRTLNSSNQQMCPLEAVFGSLSEAQLQLGVGMAYEIMTAADQQEQTPLRSQLLTLVAPDGASTVR